jgi:selenide,water dikinase
MATIPAPRLTELAVLAGCTGKAGAESLAAITALFGGVAAGADGVDGGAAEAAPNLLVGLAKPDDAAVYRVSPELAIVVTVDFFAPIVDDPYSYGAISAANAMSDVYAMGGEVTIALNIAGFPTELESDVVAEILRGGRDKVTEAGGTVAGGHTIIDAEPKYGLCVMGAVHPDRILTKAGAHPGDALFLTKPVGTGLIATAAKFDEAEPAHIDAAVESMSRLNRHAAQVIRELEPHALTDVTGFGVLGHGFELADAGDVQVRIDSTALPLLPGAIEYASRGVLTGGGFRNRDYLEGKVELAGAVGDDLAHVLFDPQTSGGLLFALDRERTAQAEQRFAAADLPLWRIGEVAEGRGVRVA